MLSNVYNGAKELKLFSNHDLENGGADMKAVINGHKIRKKKEEGGETGLETFDYEDDPKLAHEGEVNAFDAHGRFEIVPAPGTIRVRDCPALCNDDVEVEVEWERMEIEYSKSETNAYIRA